MLTARSRQPRRPAAARTADRAAADRRRSCDRGASSSRRCSHTAREVLERVPGVRDFPGLDRLSAPHEAAGARPGITAPRTSFNQRITAASPIRVLRRRVRRRPHGQGRVRRHRQRRDPGDVRRRAAWMARGRDTSCPPTRCSRSCPLSVRGESGRDSRVAGDDHDARHGRTRPRPPARHDRRGSRVGAALAGRRSGLAARRRLAVRVARGRVARCRERSARRGSPTSPTRRSTW